LSPDGKQLACGDWYGNIRIHQLDNELLEELSVIEAHENEVLSLDYTEVDDQKNKKIIESGI